MVGSNRASLNFRQASHLCLGISLWAEIGKKGRKRCDSCVGVSALAFLLLVCPSQNDISNESWRPRCEACLAVTPFLGFILCYAGLRDATLRSCRWRNKVEQGLPRAIGREGIEANPHQAIGRG